jgi:hypothetical protein
MTRKEEAIERARRYFDKLLEEEIARGILPEEAELLAKLK